MTGLIDLNMVVLSRGSHPSRQDGTCLTEAVAWWAGEDHTDRPDCLCPVLGALGRAWNDGMRSDAERAQLVPYVPALVGTAGSKEASERRGWMAADWLVRESAPAWLDAAGLSDHAARLRAAGEVTGPGTVPSADLYAARDAALYAWGAARGAGVAAWDAARIAARTASGDVLRAASWAASWAASGAASAPAMHRLQRSAHLLLRRMIAAGPHDPAALAALPEVTA